jgi:hypothetical protein
LSFTITSLSFVGGTAVITSGTVITGSTILTALKTFATTLANTPLAAVAAVILAVIVIFKEFFKWKQEGKEDNYASWKMTERDFPNITSQALQGSTSRRTIERLYDDRTLFNTATGRDYSTTEAIQRIIHESMADALFCTTREGVGTVCSEEHPATREVGNRFARLAEFFPFKLVSGGGSKKLAETYVNGVIYLSSYITLIDTILELRDPTLSRSPDVDVAEIRIPITISLSTALVPLSAGLKTTAENIIDTKISTFLDDDRDFKTVLNFGDDTQYVAEAWRLKGVTGQDTASVQLKLLKPLSNIVELYDRAFISQQVASSVIDNNVQFELGPDADTTPYLRPFNMKGVDVVKNKKLLNTATLESMGLSTGSSGALNSGKFTYENITFRRWYTDGFKASELNVDYTDYNNFVHFGSANKRISTFSEKLSKIEKLNTEITASTLSSTAGAALKALELENVIRNFDPYEQFLYYATESLAYSASAYYLESGVEYNPTGSWPKYADGTVYPVASASAWLSVQQGIAQRYDDNNANYLIKHLPDHIRDDIESSEFLTLISMVGHVMDNIKVYIDQFSNIYSTNPNPFEELTMDQVYEVAQSFGLNLPNVYSLENLQTFNASIVGESGSRASVAETWKRFLHSAIYLAKTKGSRTSVDGLLNTYGISSPIIQVKETSYPSTQNYIQSDELSYGLLLTSSVNNNYVTVPFVSASVTASSLQIRFRPTTKTSMSILTGDDTWKLIANPGPQTGAPQDKLNKLGYLKLETPDGSITSSYFPLYSDDYTHIMFRSKSIDLSIIQTDGDQILFEQKINTNILSSSWQNTENIYLGGSGSYKTWNANMLLDEVHVWGEEITDADFKFTAYDPGSYYSTNYTASYDNLYVHIALSKPLLSITQSVVNESPYRDIEKVSTFTAVGFTTESFVRVLRTVKQFTPVVGATAYSNKKITVAPPPVFKNQFIDNNNTKYLSARESIKRTGEKLYNSNHNIVSVGLSPTDFTNQNILRSMGTVDVNNIIGSPRYIKGTEYANLSELDKAYNEYYRKIINPNEYIRFFKDLTESITEMAKTIVPARAKLLEGIVIESSILKRRREPRYKSFTVSGTNTKLFTNFVSGSGSANVGAYDFTQNFAKVQTDPMPFADTMLLNGERNITDFDVKLITIQDFSKIPVHRRVKQYVNKFDTSSLAYNSVMEDKSGYMVLEAPAIDGSIRDELTSPYPRNAYLGVLESGSTIYRVPTENNTLVPLYEIPPRTDFNDVGTTSYFHKKTGIYRYYLYTRYKDYFLAKLDTISDNPDLRLLAKITLLPTSSIANPPGRDAVTITEGTYTPGTPSSGRLSTAGIFSVYAIKTTPAISGLRIRLYRTESERLNDLSRPFTTPPGESAEVLLDALLDNTEDIFPYTLIQTDNNTIYYTIENTTASSITTEVNIYYYAYEAINSIPIGYLPRHYKFSRDNRIALKRRNFLGTKYTDQIVPPNCPWDPCPPFRSRPSSGNTATANTTNGSTSAAVSSGAIFRVT